MVTYNELIYEKILFNVIISNKVKAITHAVPPPTAFAIISIPLVIEYASIPRISWPGISIENVKISYDYPFNVLCYVILAQI